MSISTVAATAPNPALMSLLSQLTGSQSASGDTSAFSQAAGGAAPAASGATSNALTGSSSGSLSSEILNLLMQMRQHIHSGGGGSSAAATSTSSTSASTLANPLEQLLSSLDANLSTSSSASTMATPLQQLFSAMDANGDGSVSESEMEGYIEKLGGTQSQADALYSQLDGNSASGISQQQLADAVSPQHGGGGHHHHHVGGEQAIDGLMQAMDSNGDGSVSQSEFTSFMTANGASASDAASDFSALDPSGSGSLTTASLTQAWENLQNNPSAASVMLVNAFAQANSVAATSSVTV
jgi:Ca2+-binding EF-hand superfamily protein